MILYSAKFHLDPNGHREDAIRVAWSQGCHWAWGISLSCLPEDCEDPGITEEDFTRRLLEEDHGVITFIGGATVKWGVSGQTRGIETSGANPGLPDRIRRRSLALGDRGEKGLRVWVIERVEDLNTALTKLHPQVKQSGVTKLFLQDWRPHRSEVTGKVHVFSLSDAAILCRRIKDPKRQHDIIIMSENDGYPDIPRTAKTLTGVAEVWMIPRDLSWQAVSILGREWTPHHGAIMTLSPGGVHPHPGEDTWDHISTNLLLQAECASLKFRFGPAGVDNRLLYLACLQRNQCIARDIPRIEEFQIDRLREKIRQLQSAPLHSPPQKPQENANLQISLPPTKREASWCEEKEMLFNEQLAAKTQELTYHRELQELALEETNRLREELESERALSRSYKLAADNSRKEAGRLRAGNNHVKPVEAQEEIPEPEDWDDVLHLIETHLKGKVALTKSCIKSLHDSPYTNKAAVWDAFKLLAGPFLRCSFGNSVDLQKESEAAGWEYNPHISATSSGRFGDEYTGNFNGKHMEFPKHLKRGSSYDPKRCFRIHFAYDADTKAIVVNHAGRHLRNTKS